MPRDAQGNAIVSVSKMALGREPFLRTDDGTELMNINGQAAGAAVVMWNGTGAGDTGADWAISTVGTSVGVESAASMKTGTNGWDTTVTTLNDMTVLDNGSMIDVGTLYSTIEFWMQPKAYPAGAKLRIRWVDSSNNLVGNQVLITNYTANMDLDVWQRVSIPIADFGLTGNVQKLQLRYRVAGGQHFWFDDFDLIAAAGGGPYRFRFAAPDANTVYHLSMAVLLISAPETGWNRDAFGNISSGLSRGLIFRHRRISDSEVLWQFVTKTNLQLFGQYHPQEAFAFADGDLLVGFMVKPGRANVRVTDDEVLDFVVRDDLTTISEMRAYCHFGVEDVTP